MTETKTHNELFAIEELIILLLIFFCVLHLSFLPVMPFRIRFLLWIDIIKTNVKAELIFFYIISACEFVTFLFMSVVHYEYLSEWSHAALAEFLSEYSSCFFIFQISLTGFMKRRRTMMMMKVFVENYVVTISSTG